MDNLKILKALANETRIKIIELLLEYNYCVRALAKRLDLTEATISQHLKILNDAGLLSKEKHGYFIHYYVNKAELIKLSKDIESLAKINQKQCNNKELCHNKDKNK